MTVLPILRYYARKSSLCLSLSLGLAYGSIAGYAQEPSEIAFTLAMRSYQNKNWAESRDKLSSYLAQYPDKPVTPAAQILLVRTYLRLDNPRKALQLINQYSAGFSSQSPYATEFVFTKAEALDAMHRSLEAIQTLLPLASGKTDAGLRADSLIARLAEVRLSTAQLKELTRSVPSSPIKEKLQILYATKLAAQQRYTRASRGMDVFLRENPRSIYYKNAQQVLRRNQNKEDGPVRIGLITSLSGTNAEAGLALKSGIELAVREYNTTHSTPLEIVTYDDRSDVLQSVLAAQALCREGSISVIIGPLESDAMSAASVVCENAQIPIISPTASQTGITGIGRFVYQANIDIESRAAALAEYAIKKAGHRTFAILSPNDVYGATSTKAFADRITQLGGRIIASESYFDNTQDFKSQLLRLRKLGQIEEVRPGLDYRITANLNFRQIDSLYKMLFPEDTTTTESSSDYNMPSRGIDALFMPIYDDEIKYIAPQIAYYNIQTKWLGGDHWNALDELRRQNKYVNGCIFVGEFYSNPDAGPTKQFIKNYTAVTKKRPTPEAFYGYDIVGVLGMIIERGAQLPDEVQNELQNGITYEGVHNQIRFDKGRRVNTSVHLLQFKDNAIHKIEP